MKDKNIKIIIICSIFVAMFFSIVGFTYAIFKLQITGNDNASSIITNLGSLELTFIDGDYISATDFMPPWTDTKTITITNTGINDVSYYLVWGTLTNTFVNKSLLTYTVTNAGAGSTLSQTQMPNSGENIQILPRTTIGVGETQTYTLTFNYENSSTIDQSSDMRKVFNGRLKVVEQLPSWKDNCTVSSNELNCNILADNPEYTVQTVTNDDMFQNTATTDMGLWTENRMGKTEDNLPTYFFRGDIDNNYVDFAGKMWRIVRINEDGSVKLILGGNTPTDGYGGTTTFNPNYDLADYVDYSRDDNALKAANEDWYSNDTKGNLDIYESYIADTKFCNDKSVAGTAGSYIYYGSFGRVSGYSMDNNFTANARTKTPQYKCPNSEDNLIYKIAVLTADEVSYAGGLYGTNNATYYLYDNVQASDVTGYWRLLSPYYYNGSNVIVFYVGGAVNPGNLGSGYVNSTLGFRPVVSLKSDTLMFRGNGTFDNPYVITE